MSLLAEFDIHCEALPLVGVAKATPDPTIILNLQYNHGDRPLFMVTVSGGEKTTIENALTDARDVAQWVLIGEAGSTRRYQAVPALSFEEQLSDEIDDLSGLESLATVEAAIERIEVRTDGWRQSGWFADRSAFDQFVSFWRANAGIRLQRLTRDDGSEPPGDGLSDRQREALRTAYERGYFEIPRKTSLEALATELGISASSVSERLRRAQTQLIEETVATTWPSLPD